MRDITRSTRRVCCPSFLCPHLRPAVPVVLSLVLLVLPFVSVFSVHRPCCPLHSLSSPSLPWSPRSGSAPPVFSVASSRGSSSAPGRAPLAAAGCCAPCCALCQPPPEVKRRTRLVWFGLVMNRGPAPWPPLRLLRRLRRHLRCASQSVGVNGDGSADITGVHVCGPFRPAARLPAAPAHTRPRGVHAGR